MRLVKNSTAVTWQQESLESSSSSNETDPRQLMTVFPEIPVVGKPVFVKADEQIQAVWWLRSSETVSEIISQVQ